MKNEILFIEPLKSFLPLKPFHRKHIVYRNQDVIRKQWNGDDSMKSDVIVGEKIIFHLIYRK